MYGVLGPVLEQEERHIFWFWEKGSQDFFTFLEWGSKDIFKNFKSGQGLFFLFKKGGLLLILVPKNPESLARVPHISPCLTISLQWCHYIGSFSKTPYSHILRMITVMFSPSIMCAFLNITWVVSTNKIIQPNSFCLFNVVSLLVSRWSTAPLIFRWVEHLTKHSCSIVIKTIVTDCPPFVIMENFNMTLDIWSSVRIWSNSRRRETYNWILQNK